LFTARGPVLDSGIPPGPARERRLIGFPCNEAGVPRPACSIAQLGRYKLRQSYRHRTKPCDKGSALPPQRTRSSAREIWGTFMSLSRRLMLCALAGAAHSPLLAQEATAPAAAPQPPVEEPEAVDAPAAGGGEEIIVTGRRIRGQVDSDIPPEVQLSEQEVHMGRVQFPSSWTLLNLSPVAPVAAAAAAL
jgi:hypothetical protein